MKNKTKIILNMEKKIKIYHDQERKMNDAGLTLMNIYKDVKMRESV